MKPSHLLKLEELGDRVVPSTTATTSTDLTSALLPTMTVPATAPDITSALTSTDGYASSITPNITNVQNALTSTYGYASSITPNITNVQNALTSTSTYASRITPISSDLTNAIASTNQVGASAPTTTTAAATTSTTTATTAAATTSTTVKTTTTAIKSTSVTTKSTTSWHTSKSATRSNVGKGSGTFTNPLTQGALTVDEMTTYNLTGTADLAGMGAVTVTGTIHSVGFVVTGRATGELTFHNSKGSVTIQLTGPQQNGFSALPETYSYKVVSHTGSYTMPAQGTLNLVVPATTSGYVSSGQGTFKLSI